MFKLIVEKELREMIGSTKFAVTFGVCSVLILLAFYVGARNYQVLRSEYDAAIAENVKQMEGLTEWRDIDHRIFLPPQPLAALVSGVSNDIGRNVEMRQTGELVTENSRFNADPVFAVFRFLDLEFIFTIVLSLFAILFAYDSINGEKERGTLRLSFANSVPRDQYILGKLIGSFIALTFPLLLPILLGCLLIPLLGVPMAGAEWLRLLMVVAAGMLYISVFLALSVFLSALTERSSSSFLLMLVIWIFAVLIIPRSAVLVAGRAVDVPSVDQVNFEKGQYNRQLWEEDRKKIMSFWEQNPGDDWSVTMRAFRTLTSELEDVREQKVTTFNEQLNENRRNRELAQQRLALGIARVSPTASFSLAAAELSATSLELKYSFLETANDYQLAYRTFMESKGNSGNQRRAFHMMDEEEEPEEINVQELPAYNFELPASGELIGASITDFGILLLFTLGFFAGAFVAFLKYDVR